MDGNFGWIDEVGRVMGLACVVGLVVMLGSFWLLEAIGKWWNGPKGKK